MSLSIVVRGDPDAPVNIDGYDGKGELQMRWYTAFSDTFVTTRWPSAADNLRVDIPITSERSDRLAVVIVAREIGPGGRVYYQVLGTASAFIMQTREMQLMLRDPSMTDDDNPDEYQRITSVLLTINTRRALAGSDAIVYERRLLRKALREHDRALAYQAENFDALSIVPAVRGIYLPTYTTAIGRLRAAAFAELSRNDTPPSLDFVAHLYESAAAFQQTTLEQIEAIIERLFATPDRVSDADLYLSLRVMTEMVSFVGNACWYDSDRHGKVMVERFGMGSGQRINHADCEDQNTDIYSFVRSVQRLEGTPYWMVKLLREYDATLITGMATTPNLRAHSAKSEGADVDEYIVHEWDKLIPSSMTPWSYPWENNRPTAAERAVQARLRDRGLLVPEGTNFAMALGMPVSFYVRDDPKGAKRIAAQIRDSNALREQLVTDVPGMAMAGFLIEANQLEQMPKRSDPTTLSSFYRWGLVMWRGRLPGEDDVPVEYAVMSGTKSRSGQQTWGAVMQDMYTLNYTLKPMYRPRLTTEEVDYLLAVQPPRVPFTLTEMEDMELPDVSEWAFEPQDAGDRSTEFRFHTLQELRSDYKSALQQIAQLDYVTGAQLNVARVTRELQVFSLRIFIKKEYKIQAPAALRVASKRV